MLPEQRYGRSPTDDPFLVPKKRKRRLGPRPWITIAVIVLVLSSSCAWSWLDMYVNINPSYEMVTERSYHSPEERLAIERAEALDLSSILCVGRYYLWGSEWEGTNVTPKEPTAYVWPILVDGSSLTFFKSKLETLRHDRTLVRAMFNYTAHCERCENLSLWLPYAQDSGGLVQLVRFPYRAICFVNRTGLPQQGGGCALMQGYQIDQRFYYHEVYNPLGAFFGKVEQTIVLDEEFHPRLIIVQYSSSIS